MREKQSKKKKQLNSYIKYYSLVAQMAVIIISGVFFGDYLDVKNNSETPIYTIFFSLASIFLGLCYVIQKTIKQNEKK